MDQHPTPIDVDDDHCNQKRAQKLLISAKESTDPSTVLSSIRKLRYCLTDEQSCSNFRLNDGLSNLTVLLKKFTREFVSILNKKLRNEETEKTSESNVENLSKSISEILGLLANCSYMDNGAKIVLTTTTTLSLVSSLLQLENLPLSIVAPILRFLGNVTDQNECARSIITSKMIPIIIRWMNKLTTFPTNDDISPRNERYSNFKTLSLILRFFNRLSSISTSTGYYLIKEDLAYHLAKFLNPQEKFYQANLEVVKIILDLLLKLLPADYCNFPEQLIRAQACEEILKIATRETDSDVEEDDYSLKIKVKKSAQDLLFSCIREHSDLRIDLSKFGVVEYLRDIVLSKCPKLSEICFLLLCKFCSDGFIRVKLRSSDALTVLLEFFRNLIILHMPSSEKFRIDLIGELINAFSSFLYDENGLECILKWRYDNTDDNLLSLYAEILGKFTKENLCPATHTLENDEQNDNLKQVKSYDSLNYKKQTNFRKNFAKDDMNFYKSQAGTRTNYSFSSPSGGYSPPAPGSAYASPCYSPPAIGLSWAPNTKNNVNNQYTSYISPNRSSPPSSNNFMWSPSPCHNPELCWSPSYSAAGSRSPAACSDTPLTYDRYSDVVDDDDGNILSEFENSEWFSDLAFAKNVKASQAERLCQCSTSSNDNNGAAAAKIEDQEKNAAIALEATVNNIIYFLSVLSHSEKFDENLSLDKRTISAILEYLSQTCRPQPRAGRLLKRLARERRLTENLLNLEFHKFVRRYLCTCKCLSDPICSHCRKLCRIGCDIILSYRMQVDADFGSGILAHKILNDSGQDDSLKFVFAIPYLIKNHARRKKFLLEYNCLERIIELLFTKSDQNFQSDAFQSLKELISLRRLKDIWSSILQRRDDLSDQNCRFIDLSIDRSNVNIIRFVCAVDDQQKNREILADKEILSQNSSFYRSMFSGSFNESTKIRFDQNADDFEALEVFLHFLYNCKKCSTIEEYFGGKNALKILFYCLEKSDEHLRADIYDHLVNYRLAKLIERSNLSKFIWRATMNDRSNLLEICMIFCLLKGNSNDLLENRQQSDDKNHSEEFKNDNCSELTYQSLKRMLMEFFTQYV